MTEFDRPGFERALGRPLMDRAGFARALAAALSEERGFAAGKLGGTEQAWLLYPLLREREGEGEERRLRAFETALGFRSLRHAGVWPTDPEFQRRFSARFASAVGELDAIGLFGDALSASAEIFAGHRLEGQPMDFRDQEPEVSADGGDCWLDQLRGRRVVIVSPYADLLRERATAATYEAVWTGAGKRWFEPASVVSLQIPYGFDPDTQQEYADALALLDDVVVSLAEMNAECALIGAGGLGIPLAAALKRRGIAAVSLGGHLQVVFGVRGERWLRRPEWRARFNDAWVGLPERYRPDPALTAEDYW